MTDDDRCHIIFLKTALYLLSNVEYAIIAMTSMSCVLFFNAKSIFDYYGYFNNHWMGYDNG